MSRERHGHGPHGILQAFTRRTDRATLSPSVITEFSEVWVRWGALCQSTAGPWEIEYESCDLNTYPQVTYKSAHISSVKKVPVDVRVALDVEGLLLWDRGRLGEGSSLSD